MVYANPVAIAAELIRENTLLIIVAAIVVGIVFYVKNGRDL